MMSSFCAGVRAMQAIHGMISISDTKLQIKRHSGEVPPVTMTKQIALMLYGEQPQAFVVTKRGHEKYRHLADMVKQQAVTCFRHAKQVQAPAEVVEAPPPPPPVPSPPVLPVLPSPVPTQPPATADQLCTSPEYFVRDLHVSENLIKVYTPSSISAGTTHTRRVVLYLPSTTGEGAPHQ